MLQSFVCLLLLQLLLLHGSNTISFYRHFISIYQFHHHVALLALCGSVSTLYVLMWGCQEECGQTTLMCVHIARVYYLPLPSSAQQADGGDLGLALKVIRVIAGDKSGCSMLADHRRGVTSHRPPARHCQLQEMQVLVIHRAHITTRYISTLSIKTHLASFSPRLKLNSAIQCVRGRGIAPNLHRLKNFSQLEHSF